MPRLLLLTPAELTRDVRAVRAAQTALDSGYEVVGVSGQISGETPVPLDDVEIIRVGRAGRINPLWFGSSAESGREHRALVELRALFRVARLLGRSARLWRAGRRVPRPAVVHANDLDTLPAGFALARRANARLVYDAHELYSEFDAPPPRLARRLILLLEGALARRADAVVTVSDGVAHELRARLGLQQDPLVVVNAPRRADLPAARATPGPLRVVYQGGLGPGRELDELLRAADADGIELTIRIRMADPTELRAAIKGRALADRVRVAEPVPPQDVLNALAEFDVGLIFDRPRTRNSDLSAPNKFFEYLMAGLAVVAPRLETLGPLIELEGIGRTYDPRSPEELPRVLEELAADREALAEMKRRARALALARLNAEAAAETLAQAWKGSRA
jgi:glycosyltransferase involved in cell wall biosynthesis